FELVFLEIRIDPQAICRHNREEIGAFGYIGADSCSPIADIAVDRSANLCIAKVEAGNAKISLGLCDGGTRLGELCVQDGELLLGGGESGLRRDEGGPRLLIERKGSLRVLPRSSTCQH